MFIIRLLMTLLFTSSVFAAVNSEDYKITTNITVIAIKKEISGYTDTNKIETFATLVNKFSLGAVFFPETYNIKMGYTTDLFTDWDLDYNPAGFDTKTESINFSFVPFYSKTYGGLYTGYREVKFIGDLKNNTGSSINVFQETSPSTASQIGTLSHTQVIASQDTTTSIEMAYLFPESSFFPDGFNISFVQESRNAFTLYETSNTPLLVLTSTDAVLLGVGILREQDSLKNGFSLRKLMYQQGVVANYSDISAQTIYLGLTYKGKLWYTDFDYVRSEMSSDSFILNGSVTSMPSNIDSMFSLSVGVRF